MKEQVCQHNHATNCALVTDGNPAVPYPNGEMRCLDCGEMFTDPPIQKRYTQAQLEAAVAEARGGECVWTPDDDGVYYTTCENAFFFDTGTATENKLKFCGYCGKNLVEATPVLADGNQEG